MKNTKKFNSKKFKSAYIETNKQSKLNLNQISPKVIKIFIILSVIFLLILILYLLLHFFIIPIFSKKNDIDFDYINYERDIITTEMREKSGWDLTEEEAYFINGILRRKKPRKCLEIGVGRGGSSILILNAIKDIKDSYLISMDIHNQVEGDNSRDIGYKVKKYFNDLSSNWQLFTGDMPHKFLENINLKYDFVLLDTTHTMPGEVLNIIEILPFLEDNAIIVLRSLFNHLTNALNKGMDKSIVRAMPSTVFLMSSLAGQKIIIKNEQNFLNIGAVFLDKNQEKHYRDYFLLLNCFWEKMLSDEKIFQLKLFIEKYYKKQIYMDLLENAILYNKEYQKNFNNPQR